MKVARRAVNGVLLLDKHADLSSGTAVGWAKRLFNAEKAGHTGTLDPFATGLLPICFGEAAKFARFMLEAEKGYRATLKLGQKSSTGDTEGEIIQERKVDVDMARVNLVLADFLGAQQQIPPMHSALKRDGVPLYKLARQGVEVAREPRDIVIHQLTASSLIGDELVIDTAVSKGTYIRVLAEDIGEKLGCGAHLAALQRTDSGGFSLAQAIGFEQLDSLTLDQRDSKLLPADSLAMALPAISLSSSDSKALQNGQCPEIAASGLVSGVYRIYGANSEFLGVADVTVTDAKTARLTSSRLMAPG